MKKSTNHRMQNTQSSKTHIFPHYSNDLLPSKQNKRSLPLISFHHRSPARRSNFSLPLRQFHMPSHSFLYEQKKKRHSLLSSSRTSDKSLTDFTLKNQLQKNLKYNALSSKIDFFNTGNNKRLIIEKRKAIVDLEMIKIRKPLISYQQKVINSNPEIFSLLEKFVHNKEMSQLRENSFIAVGKESRFGKVVFDSRE